VCQVAAAIALGAAYVTLDGLWYLPNSANLSTYSLDGFGLAILAIAAAGVIGLTRPRLAAAASAVAVGLGLFLTSWSYVALGNESMRSDPAFSTTWRVFLYVGLAVAAVGVVDLARREAFDGPIGWHRPSWPQTALLVAGTLLGAASLALDVDSQGVWAYSGGQAVSLLLLAAAFSWVTVTVRSEGSRHLRVAVTAYLSASALAALYLAVAASSAFGAGTALGDICLALAVVTSRHSAGVDRP
jgi:hypothetical protein